MKKALVLVVLFIICSGLLVPAIAEVSPYNLKVKHLYAKPDGRSKIVYEIPLEVKLLNISEDANWYEVYIEFSLGIVKFNYSGWAYIPVGTMLAERNATKVAATLK